MSTYLVINHTDDINVENFKVGMPRNQKYSIIRYMDPKDKSRKHLYLQTPSVHLGNLVSQPGSNDDTTDPEQRDSQLGRVYMELYLHRAKEEFRKLINEIDIHIMKRIWINREEWGLSKDTTLIDIERHWIPSLKLSILDFEQNCLKFVIPLKAYGGKEYLDMDAYDHENCELPLSLIKPEYQARGLLFYKGVIKDGNYFSLDWELKQLKVKIPDQIFDECQLSDEEEGTPDWYWDDEI